MVSVVGNTDGLTYDFDGTTLTITGTGPMKDIASTSVNSGQLVANTATNVVIGEGVTSVGGYAFWNVTNIKSVKLPSTITSIGDYALCNIRLSEIEIPANVSSFGYSAMANNIDLEFVIFRSVNAPTLGSISMDFKHTGGTTVYTNGWGANVNWSSYAPNSTIIPVTGLPTTYKKITYASNKVQVDSAIRDKNGTRIDTNYAKKATTLAGYGITDAHITSDVITLGANTITPLVTSQKVTSWQSTVSDSNIPSEKLTKDTLDTKVDKITSGGNIIYGYNNIIHGQNFSGSYGPALNTIPIRDSPGGVLRTAPPQSDDHCATKKYVDDLVGVTDITSSVTNIPSGGSIGNLKVYKSGNTVFINGIMHLPSMSPATALFELPFEHYAPRDKNQYGMMINSDNFTISVLNISTTETVDNTFKILFDNASGSIPNEDYYLFASYVARD